jgi:hypothetical protein
MPTVALSAQQGTLPGAESGQSQTASIEGTVVNAQTGEPIAHAQIMAFVRATDGTGRLEPRQANTDFSGHFSIGDLAPGRYRLRADADHFAPQAYGGHPGSGRPGIDVVIESGQHLRDITFRLLPCGSISGAVADQSGKPAAGVSVRALPVNSRSVSPEAQTDRRGHYRIADLIPDEYMVQAFFSLNAQDRAAGPGRTYPATYYPGTTEFETGIPVSVQAGNETDHIDIDLKPVHAVRVRGLLLDLDSNKPPQDGWVMLVPRSADPAARGTALSALTASSYSASLAGAQGRFEIDGVPSGSYWAIGKVPDENGGRIGRVSVEVGETDIEELRVGVGADVDVHGRLSLDPGGVCDFSKVVVSLYPQEPLISFHEEEPGSAGSFVLRGVEPGSYRVGIQGLPPGYYLKSARLGGGEVLDTGLTVEAATSATALDIVLGSPGGSLSGLVLNDDAPAQATVCLVPNAQRRDRRDLYLRNQTRGDGSFSLTGIAPGDYKAFAFASVDLRAIFNASWLQGYESKGESVHVEEGQSQSVRLQLIQVDDQP